MDFPYWVDFELGEDVRSETRLLQDESWKGSVSDGRGHVSNREAARLHASQFVEAISWFHVAELIVDLYNDRASRMKRLPPELLRHVFDYVCGQGIMVIASLSRRYAPPLMPVCNFRLVARKRPLLQFELDLGEYDCAWSRCIPQPTTLTLHDGRLARNGRRLTMQHRTYTVDRALGEEIDNEDFVAFECEAVVARMLAGGAATLLFFGQTGTGKTYSFSGCLGYILNVMGCRKQKLRATFYEIHGKDAFDLLHERKKVFLRADAQDKIHVRGARVIETSDEEELFTKLSAAMLLRSSQATERNPLSSRSHAVFLLEMVGEDGSAGGSVRLVDLAGSERNYETLKMTAAEHRSSADINVSLSALKDCFVAAHGGQRIPHRSHLLTRVLQDCFKFKGSSGVNETALHMTTVIATLSPSPTDLLHSINTLDHAIMLNPDLEKRRTVTTVELPRTSGSPLSHIPVDSWSAENVRQWLSSAENGRFAALAVPNGMVGADLMRLNQNSLTALFAGQLRKARVGEEGEAWVVDAAGEGEGGEEAGVEGENGPNSNRRKDQSRTSVIGRALWAALRRETNSALSKAKTMQFL